MLADAPPRLVFAAHLPQPPHVAVDEARVPCSRAVVDATGSHYFPLSTAAPSFLLPSAPSYLPPILLQAPSLQK
jgi:hypothetical protein